MCRPALTVILWLLLWLPASCFSQDPYFTFVGESQGLPSNEVFDLFQDSRGFIWVCTNAGLSRFDGMRFRTFYSNEVTSLPGSNIFEDSEGRIWYENFDGFNCYVKDDSLHAFPQDSTCGYVRSAQVGNYLVIPRSFGADLYDIQTLTHVKYLPSGSRTVVTRQGTDDFHFMVSNEGTHQVTVMALLPDGNWSPDKTVMANSQNIFIEPVDVGGKWYLVQRGKNRLQKEPEISGAYTYLPSQEDLGFVQVFEVIDSNLWLADVTGLVLYEPSRQQRINKTKLFKDLSISAMLKDSEGNYWLGTLGKGLVFIPDLNSRFLHPSQIPLTRIAASEDHLYFGTQDGLLFQYDGEGENPEIIYQVANHHALDAIVHVPELGKLLVGHPESGFIDLESPYTHTQSPGGSGIKDGVYLTPSYMAVCEPYGASLMRIPGADTMAPDPWDSLYAAHHTLMGNGGSRIKDGRCRAICKYPDRDEFLFGSSAGFFAAKPKGLTELKKDRKSLFPAQLFESGGFVYGLTTLGQLFVADPQQQVHSLAGLPESGPWLKMEIQGDRIFLLSYYNLYSAKVKGLSLLEPTLIPGLNPSKVNDMTFWKGQVALSTDEGLVIIDPYRTTTQAIQPMLRINSFEISGKHYDPAQKVFASYGENEVRIDYSILFYRAGGKYPLWYRINDGQWSSMPATLRTLILPVLKPGDYRIEFCLGAPDASPEAVIQFEIGKPYWQRGWFIAACALAGLGVVVVAFSRRTRRIRKTEQEKLRKQELESDLRHSKLTALRSQMNPHFIFNALNSVQSYIVSGDKANASGYLGKFSKLTRNILEMSEKEYVSLAEEIEALTLYLDLEKARFADPFHFSLFIEEGIHPEKVFVPSLFIQPFCENAVKHGLLHKRGEKQLNLSFRIKDGWLEALVDDNGIGRVKSFELNQRKVGKHKSFSADATLRRVELLNRESRKVELEYIDKTGPGGEPTGTTVKILIKVEPKNT